MVYIALTAFFARCYHDTGVAGLYVNVDAPGGDRRHARWVEKELGSESFDLVTTIIVIAPHVKAYNEALTTFLD